jgi:hypothetical protein
MPEALWMNQSAKLVFIVLSAAIAALFVHELLELGQAHARDELLPITRGGMTYE